MGYVPPPLPCGILGEQEKERLRKSHWACPTPRIERDNRLWWITGIFTVICAGVLLFGDMVVERIYPDSIAGTTAYEDAIMALDMTADRENALGASTGTISQALTDMISISTGTNYTNIQSTSQALTAEIERAEQTIEQDEQEFVEYWH